MCFAFFHEISQQLGSWVKNFTRSNSSMCGFSVLTFLFCPFLSLTGACPDHHFVKSKTHMYSIVDFKIFASSTTHRRQSAWIRMVSYWVPRQGSVEICCMRSLVTEVYCFIYIAFLQLFKHELHSGSSVSTTSWGSKWLFTVRILAWTGCYIRRIAYNLGVHLYFSISSV